MRGLFFRKYNRTRNPARRGKKARVKKATYYYKKELCYDEVKE